ncbi:MAG: COX15/CtaA family protein [Saprospiraceae bacterium]|nr:COX15/CtaA family protein [Saprospiraceae bacterium]MCF8252442.1 COX15/CtaA family protein [Saprospiraceae bacterium]MCF8282289.1 COX15/CtaA family protein [Bacteroidales bacterium]MCF8314032.1 COX15/CtaA family protein [Saprospiraceae bacterium]MCF8442772.1 COX15/CtaA family protein [Saprospiraceae bacterium]
MRTSTTSAPVSKSVRLWLLAGVVMVFFQVVIGGVTRLTDSGLSITEWAVIQGTLPPLNEAEWQVAFDKYKVAAKKQFETLHADMALRDFKFIFFWEYAHRLWARMMGFVFLFPFLWFLVKKQMPGWLLRRLGVVIGLAMLAAVFGWIMVASGLNNDNRTWVSAYKLVTHLGIATVLFAYLFWTWRRAAQPIATDGHLTTLRRLGWWTAGVLFVQIAFGGLMAGMRAGLIHPHFPVFVEWGRFWQVLTAGSVGTEQMLDYEPQQSIKAVVQLLHRGMAWVLTAMVVFLFLEIRKQTTSARLRFGGNFMLGMLGVQFLLGILTIINCIGRVPLAWGAIHQAGALVLLAAVLHVNFQFLKK